MSRVRFDFLPGEMTQGERAAIAEASSTGWISPPVYNSLKPEPPRPWRTAHLRYLERRGLVDKQHRRIDGLLCVRLNAAGLALKRVAA